MKTFRLETLVLAAFLAGCAAKQPPVTHLPPATPTAPRPTSTPLPPVYPVPFPTPLPRSSPVPVPTPAKLRVAIFAGHVAHPPTPYDRKGSISASGIFEYVFNDQIAQLFSGFGSAADYLVFPAADNVPLKERPARAQAAGAQVYIEIHHDSAQPKDIERLRLDGKTPSDWQELSGFSVFYSERHGKPLESQRLATLIAEELHQRGFHPNLYHAQPIPGESRELLNPGLGIYEGSYLSVLRENMLPAAVVECGVVVNPYEEVWLERPQTQQRIVEAIDSAIARYVLIPANKIFHK